MRIDHGTALAEVCHARIAHVMEIINIRDRNIAGLIRFRAYEYMRGQANDYWEIDQIVAVFRRESYLQRKGYYRWLLKG